ncbi:hypothetical protein [Thermaerobacillus caldiproteolyticus]|uniref:hypothetical protein n=1 Tax=Thermaerobacillus caldiproteolyticus TaxID=247480 RepID=UPI0018F1A531|nr:hypothetical protein [Anoxybacillus caldiproteolyticus]
MKNETYGKLILNVSMEVEENSGKVGFLQANYTLNDLILDIREINVKDVSGNVYKLKVHDASIEWEDFFGEDE